MGDDAVVTWQKHAGKAEDGWTGMVRAMEDVFDVIEGIDLVSACGRVDRNLILLTDEDRDDRDGSLSFDATFQNVKDLIKSNGYILNAILNVDIDGEIKNLGMKMEVDGGPSNTIFQQDANEPLGYKTITDTRPYKSFVKAPKKQKLMNDHYSDLVVDTAGALWNLNS